jgi:hypothetical protein
MNNGSNMEKKMRFVFVFLRNTGSDVMNNQITPLYLPTLSFTKRNNNETTPISPIVHHLFLIHLHPLSIRAAKNTLQQLRLRHRKSGTPVEANPKGLQSHFG